jgi:DNA polymerase III delta subunit
MADQADIEALVKAAKAGTLKPIVLIHGNQSFLVKQAYDRILSALVPEDIRAFNLEQMDGTQAEVGQVLDGFNTLPLMAGNKVVGVTEARFFISKANAAELLEDAKERWSANEPHPALRQLGKVLSLAQWGWQEGLDASDDQWVEALDLKAGEMTASGGAWLKIALQQAINSGLNLQSGGDESGSLCEGLEASLKLGGAGLYLVCSSSSADARKKLYKLFYEQGHVLDFKTEKKGPQASLAAKPFLAQILKQQGLTAKNSIGDRLVAAYGGDLGIRHKEIEKLAAYAYPRTELTDADVKAVCTPVLEDDVFELFRALGSKKIDQALGVLRRQLAVDPKAPFQLFSMLCAELRKLVVMRALMDEGKIPAKGPIDSNSFKFTTYPKLIKELPVGLAALVKKTNSYALYQTMERARSMSGPQLREMVSHVAELDYKVKTGGMEASDALEELVLRFCGVREEAIL